VQCCSAVYFTGGNNHQSHYFTGAMNSTNPINPIHLSKQEIQRLVKNNEFLSLPGALTLLNKALASIITATEKCFAGGKIGP